MRTTPPITLAVRLDRDDDRPLPVQVSDAMRQLVVGGVLAPGDAVPSSRALAGHLAVSRGTVTAAFEQLSAEGYLIATEGRGTVVNPRLAAIHPSRTPPSRATPPRPTTGLIDLRPGRPWTASVSTPGWRSAWRRAAADPFGTAPSSGDPGLRNGLAEHLRLMRGVVRPPEQLVVTAGAREGLALLLHALRRPQPVGVEQPGYPSLRRVPERLGLTVRALPADRHGLITDALPETDPPALLVVTPSHQYPLGGSMPIERRQQLLAWAGRHDVVVVEDDYDAELRYTSQPLPALAALDDPEGGRVVTLGTFAKTIGPGLGAGYLLAPARLLGEVTRARTDLGQPVAQLTQRALADYLGSGELRRHIQRMRRLYRRRRDVVAAALDGLPGAEVYPMDGGLHVVVETARAEAAVLADARARGVLLGGLSGYWSGRPSGLSGVVFGFGGVSDEQLRRALSALAAAVTG